MSRPSPRQPVRLHRTDSRLAPLIAAGLLACASVPVHAQQSPYYLSASQRFGYDSNLFRVADGQQEQSDIISTTSLTIGVDQPIGRHRVYSSIGASRTTYGDNDALDNTGYNFAIGANIEASSRLSGSVQLGASRSQASFSSYGAQTSTTSGRNLEEARTADLRIQYGGASILVLEGLANYTDVDYTATGFASRERRSHMFGAGARYQLGGPWTLGLTTRWTTGSYPSFTVGTADDYDRTDVDLVATYAPTGASRLTARLTKTKEEHDLDTAQDFDGVTGELNWSYQPTGKLALNVNVARETGSGSTGYTIVPPTRGAPPGSDPAFAYLTDSRLSSRLGIDARWTATAKIVAIARASYSHDRYDSSFVGGSGDLRGSMRSYGLTIDYNITRVWALQAGLGHEQRRSDVVIGGQSYEYNATTSYLGVTLRLQ